MPIVQSACAEEATPLCPYLKEGDAHVDANQRAPRSERCGS
jgi:hypothetical protein